MLSVSRTAEFRPYSYAHAEMCARTTLSALLPANGELASGYMSRLPPQKQVKISAFFKRSPGGEDGSTRSSAAGASPERSPRAARFATVTSSKSPVTACQIIVQLLY